MKTYTPENESVQAPRAQFTDTLKRLFRPHALRAVFHASASFLIGAFCNRDGFLYIVPAYITGCWAAKNDFPAAFLGGIVGCILSGRFKTVFCMLIMAILFSIWSVWQGAKNIKTRDRYMILAAALLLSVAVLDLSAPERIFLGLFNTAAALLFSAAAHLGIRAINSYLIRKRAISSYEKGAALLFLCLLSFALSYVSLSGGAFTAGHAFACALAVVGMSTGGIFGVLTALSAGFGALISESALAALTACGCMGAAMAAGSVFSENKRWLGALCCGAGMILMGVILTNTFTVFEVITGGVAGFLCTIRVNASMYGASTDENTGESDLERFRMTAFMLNSLSAEMYEYADSVSPDAKDSFLDASRRLTAVGDALCSAIEGNRRDASRKRFNIKVGHALESEIADDISGDSVFVEINAHHALIVLSDGMGTGETAHAESSGFIELLRQFIEAGFEVSEAVHCANKLMIDGKCGTGGETDNADDEMYATADVLMFQRATGEGLIVKHGAPPSFIVRGSRIITVYGEALPIGILGEAEAYTHSVNLESGDWVVMLTDGVSDALCSHLIAVITEILSQTDDPDTAAYMLLSAANELRLSPPDDMTAVFMHVE